MNKEIEWFWLARKGQPLTIISIDAVATGLAKYFSEFHDGKTKINHYMQVKSLNARLMAKQDFDAYSEMFKENEEKIVPWTNSWLKHFAELTKFAQKINKLDLKSNSNEQLARAFKKFYELASKAYSFAYDYKALNTFYPEKTTAILSKRIKAAEKVNSYLNLIFSLHSPIDLHKEKTDLLKIAIRCKNKKLQENNLEKLLKKHYDKYAYLKMYLNYGSPFTVQEFITKLNDIGKGSVYSLKKELLEEQNKFHENNKKVKKIIKELKLNRDECKVLENIRTVLHASMFCDELYTKVAFNIRPLLMEIGRRFSLSYNQMYNLRNIEIIEMLEKNKLGKSLFKSISERMIDHALVLNCGKVNLLTSKKLMKYTKKLREFEKGLENLRELTGESAFQGKVKGIVRIVGSEESFRHFKKGEILVTGCTAPQYVPIMKKALAIITDEGGMLSHAAIMSREFAKPCIIGTKIATRVLKTGDLIELDAEKGIIRKL